MEKKTFIPQNKVGTILNASGVPMQLSYNFTQDTKTRKMYTGYSRIPLPENEEYTQSDRLKVIAWLRRQLRENALVSAIATRYAISVGCPTIHSLTKSEIGLYGENLYYNLFKNVMYGERGNLSKLSFLLSIEELVAGEAFVVFAEGKLQVIPAEMVGSPNKDKPKGEIDGINYWKDGTVKYIRVGSYKKNNYGVGEISYEDDDSTKVSGEYVYHYGTSMRHDEKRFLPKLAPAMTSIADVDQLIKNKNIQIANQTIFSLFCTKNSDPALFTKMIEDGGNKDYIMDMALARSNYASVQNGSIYSGEVGEDIKLIEPNINANDFNEYVLGRIDNICAVLQMPPELAVTGFRKSNFSSAKMDTIRFHTYVKSVRESNEPFYDTLMKWYKDAYWKENNEEFTLIYPPLPEMDAQRTALTEIAYLNAGLRSKSQLSKNSEFWGEDLDNQLITEASNRLKKLQEKAKELNVPVELLISQMPNGNALAQTINSINTANEKPI